MKRLDESKSKAQASNAFVYGWAQGLVLAPTRELAQQIEKVMRALGDYLGVRCHACVGGTSVREDMGLLSAGVHVVVGTPGRVYDMLRRRALNPDKIKMFVLDEADEMLSRGFKDQVRGMKICPPYRKEHGLSFSLSIWPICIPPFSVS